MAQKKKKKPGPTPPKRKDVPASDDQGAHPSPGGGQKWNSHSSRSAFAPPTNRQKNK